MSQIVPTSQHHLLESIPLLALKIFCLCFFIETVYALLILALLGTTIGEQYAFGSLTFLWLTHTVKFIFEIILVLQVIIRAFATRYYIGNGKLTMYSGVFDQAERVYDLHQLKNIVLVQNWLGRHLKYGDLRLTLTSSGYKEELVLAGLNDPRKYERLLREQFLGN